MRKKILVSLIIMIVCLSMCTFITSVKADSDNVIKSIDMDIHIDNEGTATIKEVWKCKVSEGTEVYHPYYSLGNSKFYDLTVKDEDGKIYETLPEWDTSGTLKSKAYKCGFHGIKNGVEICWGQSEHGNKEYIVTYKITDFVVELEDCQMTYWTLIPHDFSTAVKKAKVTISADDRFERDMPVWGYGDKGGICRVENGKVVMESNDSIRTKEYMTLLIKYPKDTFSLSDTSYKMYNFDHYLEMAEQDADHYERSDKISLIIGMLFAFGYFGFMILVIIVSIPEGKKRNAKENLVIEGKKLPSDIEYFRDIPCKDDLLRAYFISCQYGITTDKTAVIGAVILKWIKQGVVKLLTEIDGKELKKGDYALDLRIEHGDLPQYEQKLFGMMYEASKDGILEKKEFEKWCRGTTKLIQWFKDVNKSEFKRIKEEGLATCQEKKSLWVKYDAYVPTQELKNVAIQLKGLKKYLEDYTLIKDREAIEVHLFEDYLIYAQLFGIAKKVADQFKKLYPDMVANSCYGSYDTYTWIHISTYNNMYSARSYSSGGGGFSSGGGGGGSFGGGGGGGGFR